LAIVSRPVPAPVCKLPKREKSYAFTSNICAAKESGFILRAGNGDLSQRMPFCRMDLPARLQGRIRVPRPSKWFALFPNPAPQIDDSIIRGGGFAHSDAPHSS